jgi:hypothetical protein
MRFLLQVADHLFLGLHSCHTPWSHSRTSAKIMFWHQLW